MNPYRQAAPGPIPSRKGHKVYVLKRKIVIFAPDGRITMYDRDDFSEIKPTHMPTKGMSRA